jgi:hypothetical protein
MIKDSFSLNLSRVNKSLNAGFGAKGFLPSFLLVFVIIGIERAGTFDSSSSTWYYFEFGLSTSARSSSMETGSTLCYAVLYSSDVSILI